MKTLNRFIKYLLPVAAGLLLSSGASADTHISTVSNPTWKAECSSCHVAYPPSLLPADSWRALMSGLDKHFGVDASVDAKSAAEIGAFLQKNAGRNRGASTKPILRITETPGSSVSTTRWVRRYGKTRRSRALPTARPAIAAPSRGISASTAYGYRDKQG